MSGNWEGEAPAEPRVISDHRLGRSLTLPEEQTKSQTLIAAIVLCIIGVFIAANLHLLITLRFDIHLATRHVGRAFGLGSGVGLSIVALGRHVKQSLFAGMLGVSACYAIALAYVVIGVGIALDWIY